MSKPVPAKYKTTHWPEYDATLKARGLLMIWLDPKRPWPAEASAKRGRPPTFSDAALPFCRSLQVLFGLALRQTLGFVESRLKWAGLDWRVPNDSTLSRRQQTLTVQIPARRNRDGRPLRMDSTGIKFLGEGEWKRKKHDAEYRRQWRKVHLGIDAQTLEIRAIEVRVG